MNRLLKKQKEELKEIELNAFYLHSEELITDDEFVDMLEYVEQRTTQLEILYK